MAMGIRVRLTLILMRKADDGVFKAIVLEGAKSIQEGHYKWLLTEHLPTYSSIHEYGGGEVLLSSARSEDSVSESDSESSPVSVSREVEPRRVAPAASDPIPEITEPDPITHVAPTD